MLLTTLLVLLPSAYAADDTVNITYLGFTDDSESFEVLSAKIFNEYYKKEMPNNFGDHINYHYINAYDADSVKKFMQDPGGYSITYANSVGQKSVSIKDQDIVIFHMVDPSYIGYADLYDDLETAKEEAGSGNLVLIEIQGMGTSSVFDVHEDIRFESLISKSFAIPHPLALSASSLRGEITSLTHLTLYHLIETYAPDEKVKALNELGMCLDDGTGIDNTVSVLYVGYDLPNVGDTGKPFRYSGMYGFENMYIAFVERTLYFDYIGKVAAVSYGTAPDVDVFNSTEGSNVWWSVSTLEMNMAVAGIDFNDFDIILFDGFFNDQILKDFEDVFENINDDTLIVFNTLYIVEGQEGRSGADCFVYRNGASEPTASAVIKRPLSHYPSGTNVILTNNQGFRMDRSLTSSVNQMTQAFTGFFLPLLKNNGNAFSAGLTVPGTIALPTGNIWDPVTNTYYPTVEAYKTWYESTSRYSPDKPYIGIFGFGTYRTEMAQFAADIEKKGYNPIIGADGPASSGYKNVYDDLDGYFYDDVNDTSHVAVFISMKNWALNYGHQPAGVASLEKLGVPVIKVVGGEGWGESTGYDANSGIPASVFMWMASASNVDGMLDFISLNDENRQWITDQAIAWAKLSEQTNAAKEVAIMYYNYPPGKAEIGANYLNVMRSLAGDGAKAYASDPTASINNPSFKGILREMKSSGGGPDAYDVRFDHLPLVTIAEGGEFVFDYTVTDESLIMNEVNLVNLIYAQGINVGSYAPGVLDTMVQQRIDFIKAGGDPDDWWGCELIPVRDYLEWLEHETTPVAGGGNGTMDISLYNDLIKTWGTPTFDGAIPTNTSEFEAWGGMIWKDTNGEIEGGIAGMNYIVIPMVQFGNVRVMPEPNRALASDKAIDSGTYHSGDLPPTHQYVAFYMWLNRGTTDSTGSGRTGFVGGDEGWKADAVIHFGTHGTQEWLPGTSVGLYRTHDWGPVLLPDVPNIYPYIVANVGEGLTAEYRGNALIISHMTPPMIKTRLYDEIVEMETAIRGYQKQDATGSGNPPIMQAYREIIIGNVFALGWQDAFPEVFGNYKKEIAKTKYSGNVNKVTNDDLKEYIANDKAVFDVFLEDYLHNFVEAIRENSLSYGMHTYGDFDEKQIAPMVWNMWSRQGLDDVLLDTYFKGEPSIPTNDLDLGVESGGAFKYDEDNILAFVELLSTPGLKNVGDIRTALQSAFGETNKDYEDKVIYFLLGPSAYLSDSAAYPTGADAVAAWKTTKIDGVSVYDSMVEEFFEFYFYFNVPSSLVGSSGTHRDTKGNYLDDAKMEAAMIAFADEVITSGNVDYRTVEKSLAKQFNGGSADRPWYNDRMTYYVLGNYRIAYGDNLRAVGDAEMNALKSALNGGYISPSSGNDPVLNPFVLPTGRNFYGIDPSTYSTPAAWKVGQAMGEQLLIDYYNTYGEFPQTVSFMRFGVDFIQDEGTLEACLFYLLGCEPTWGGTGTFTGAKPVVAGDSNYDDMFKLNIKGQDVWRPRVDVVYNSAGMRDGYGSMLRYIDKAVKAVALLDDSDDKSGVSNSVKKNVDELSALLKGSGLSNDEIWELATSRVFAQQLGQYEIGTGNAIGASGNFDPNDPDSIKTIADTYLMKMGYLYTEGNWGQSSEQITKMLQALLGRTDASIFASAGNLYDSLDNDDVFQYFGAMNMVSSMYDRNGNYISDSSQWKTPQMYIADTSNIHNYKDGNQIVYTASAYIQKDLAARYLNDAWIQGQIEAGYSGAMMYAEVMQNLYGWSVVSNGELIGQETWNRVFEKYQSEDMVDYLSHTSPYALQSITGSMLESVRMGYWDASDEQLKQLMQNYVESVIQSGVACCHHTCGNPTLDKFIAGQMSVLGLTPEEEEKYWQAVEGATEREKPDVSSPSNSARPSGSGYGTAVLVDAGQTAPAGEQSNQNEQNEQNEQRDENQEPGQGAGVEPGTPVSGFEMRVSQMTSSVRDFFANPSFSSSSIIAIAFVVIVVGAVFYGLRRKGL